MVKIVRTDRELECPRIDETLSGWGGLELLPDGISEAELVRAVSDADLLLMCYTPITRTVIEAAMRLKGIVKYGVGIDAIDLAAAMEREIPVVNIPEYAEETVAEGAFALLIALAKKLVLLDGEMKRTGWAWPNASWLGLDIAGKTIGLVGVGKIGRSMARMAGLGFGARVLGYDPHVAAKEMDRAGVKKYDDLHAMLAQCDFVTIHCTLTPQTHGLFGAQAFAAMKRSAFLINVSRGAIVDETAMMDALKSGRLAGAGIDVYGQEPLALRDHPLSSLFDMPNVVMLPHLTFYTKEAMERLQGETLERCAEILEGRPVKIKSRDPRLRMQENGVEFVD